MGAVTETGTAAPAGPSGSAASPATTPPVLLAGLVVAVVAGLDLALSARAGAAALLAGVAVLQGVFALAWVFGTGMPGRWGALIISAFAAAAVDTTASVWPHSRLGSVVAVLGLALAVMFVHQLWRGAARVHVVGSLSAAALLVLAVVGPAAFVQLRHEIFGATSGGRVVSAAVGAVAGALVVGYLVDLVLPTPRFDAAVARGLPAVVVSGVVGAAVAYLVLRDAAGFRQGRAVFVGAALGVTAGLLAVGAAFVLHELDVPLSSLRAQLRPVVAALLPLLVLGPMAFLLCLAIRT
jgi:hypothetical protein